MAIKKLPSTGDRPQHTPTPTGLPQGQTAGGSGDSAGFPWAGRSFDHHGTAFANDDGQTPAEYAGARERFIARVAGYTDAVAAADPTLVAQALTRLAEAERKLLAEFAKIRVLIPLVAEGGDFGVTDSGKIVEKTQELSIVTVAAPDGRTAMPVFTSTETMRAWDGTARPIPVPVPQAVIAAAQEETPLIVIDPASSATRVGVRAPRFEEIASGKVLLPGWADNQFAKTVQEFATSADKRVRFATLMPLDPRLDLTNVEAELVLGIAPGHSREAVQSIAANISAAWESNTVLSKRIDSVRLKFVPAGN
ncbi:SseB family protein [Canibacter zhoujuaniae]|uniref:SseB family protein n=1 Tax=Canibacter zhoujuaniae TaxID=2708343 RepID=UPI0014204B67|nr:SseB family protein [Canibacter zhoujuaniae]